MVEQLEGEADRSEGDGLVLVDGDRFDLVRGARVVRRVGSSPESGSGNADGASVPDGYVLVDGALLRVAPS